MGVRTYAQPIKINVGMTKTEICCIDDDTSAMTNILRVKNQLTIELPTAMPIVSSILPLTAIQTEL